MKTRSNTRASSCSLYPERHPPGSHILVSPPPSEELLSLLDKSIVALSSLFFVGSVAWVPFAVAWAWRRWKTLLIQADKNESNTNDSTHHQNRNWNVLYKYLLLTCLISIPVLGPHRYPRVGEWLGVRRWSLWKRWLRYIAFEVVADSATAAANLKREDAIVAISPHGIFPFALAFAALPQLAYDTFGSIRPVVATATNLFPFVNTLLKWLQSVDASRYSVDKALSIGARIGLAPGGISEMFEGFPKPGTHPDEEYAITRHKGFLKLAMKHGKAIIPIYCFGASKMFRRLQLPNFFERVSKVLKTSIVIFFGSWGLPIPFRQRLLYVVGEPIFPPYLVEGKSIPKEDTQEYQHQLDEMHSKFCDALTKLFERHKQSYGWGHKALKLI